MPELIRRADNFKMSIYALAAFASVIPESLYLAVNFSELFLKLLAFLSKDFKIFLRSSLAERYSYSFKIKGGKDSVNLVNL